MKIADLFIGLKIDGDNKAVQALTGIKRILTDVTAKGLATKAAILGVVYGLEKLTSESGKFGNKLTNQSLLTGMDTTKIQQWGEYFRKSGGDAEDAASSLFAAQKIMTDIKEGNGVPIGVAAVSRDSHFDLLSHLDDPAAIAEAVIKYIRTTKDAIGIANMNAESLGFTPGAIAVLRKNGEDINAITANIASHGELNRLDRVYVAWSNFNKQWEHIRNALTAKFGMGAVDEISNAMTLFSGWILVLAKLDTKIHVFRDLGVVLIPLAAAIAAAGAPLTAFSLLIVGIIFLMGEWQKHKMNQASIFGDKNVISEMKDYMIGKDGKEGALQKGGHSLKKLLTTLPTSNEMAAWNAANAAVPAQPVSAPASTTTNNHATVHQVNHGVKDAKETVHPLKRATMNALQSISTKDQAD
jgi:hypothetical protein